MADEFTERATALAVKDAETELIEASRAFEDAQRAGVDDYTTHSGAEALRRYNRAILEYNNMTGANQPQQQANGQLSVAQRNFLSRRAALGDDITPARMKDYALAHTRAVNAGLEPDTPQYFSAVERSVDSMGDGRQELLNERSAAQICGVDEETYAHYAQKLRNMRARGEYGS